MLLHLRSRLSTAAAVAVAVLFLSASALPVQQHPKMIGSLLQGDGGNLKPLDTYITVTQPQRTVDGPVGQTLTSIKDFLLSVASSQQSEQIDPTTPMVANYTWVGIGYCIEMNIAALEMVRSLKQVMCTTGHVYFSLDDEIDHLVAHHDSQELAICNT